MGKSTLIDEFLRVHPDFVHEPEPYTVLVEDLGEEFSAEPSVEDFHATTRIQHRSSASNTHRGEQVIYERCPIDFLAYIDALDTEKCGTRYLSQSQKLFRISI